MSVETSVSEILANLEGRRPGSWARHSAHVADGIRGSGIIDRIDSSSDRLDDRLSAGFSGLSTNLAGLAAVVGVSAQSVAAEISTSNRFLTMVIDTLRDPRATGANERFRSGIHAYGKGWVEEAIEEFEESIRLFRFHAPTHAMLGHALMREHKLTEAAASYALAAKYSTPDDLEFAAGCTLLAAGALEANGDLGAASDLLRSRAEDLSEFAEVGLTLARISQDQASVSEALKRAPDLVVAALAAHIPGVEKAALDLATSADGPVALAVSLREVVAEIELHFSDATVFPGIDKYEGLGSQAPIDDLMSAAALLAASNLICAKMRGPIAVSRSSLPAPSTVDVNLAEARSALQVLRADEDRLSHQIAEKRKAITYGRRLLTKSQPSDGGADLLEDIRAKLAEADLVTRQSEDIESELRASGVTLRPFSWPGRIEVALKRKYGAHRQLAARLFVLEREIATLRQEAHVQSKEAQARKEHARSTAAAQVKAGLDRQRALDGLLRKRSELEPQGRALESQIEELERKREAEIEASRLAEFSELAHWQRLAHAVAAVVARIPARRHPWNGSSLP
ncbi:MAG: hypothetical protein KKH51_08375 [Actinobacteria bacterium]|nr:hypothetical protein [Actinomycetota bacterium]